MTDRELLEAAANAVGGENGQSNGLFYQWHDLPHTGVDRVLRYVGQREWNPLENDGDALRLAVKLRLSLDCWSTGATVTYDVGEIVATDLHEEGEPLAATRRAIVRAAAAIGVAA